MTSWETLVSYCNFGVAIAVHYYSIMIRPEPLTRTSGLQDMKTITGLQISRWALPLLLLLALLHGVQYAALMPPWG